VSSLTDDVAALDIDGLNELSRRVEHELSVAVRRGEPAGSHARLLDRIESRLERVSDEPAPATVPVLRRQQIAAARGDRHPRRSESSR
jgi:hypothetical protein